ncbi:MAG TPA: Uma2 family endonuclease [Hyphomicrobiaceae bacterium]|nr:Uma2 family endonuclease [Hyphomicrobiaceae bacterium]
MAQPVERAATYEDLLAVPEPLVAEILFGRIVTHPRPAPRHAAASSALGNVLGPPFQFGRDGPGGWLFLDEPELHLGPHVAVPDLAAWRRERLPALPETAWIGVAPDWVCEVLSPSTERYDRGDKRVIYAEAGVGHVWHVDPVLRMLEVFELRDGKWLLLDVFRDDVHVAAPPFAEHNFSLGLLWPFDSPAETQS